MQTITDTVRRILGAPPNERRGLGYVARKTGLAVFTLRRRVGDGRLSAARIGDTYYTLDEFIDQMVIDDTARAAGKRQAEPAPVRTPAAKSRSHAAAMKKLRAAGLLGADQE
jgi:hypothetical protein